MQLTNGVYRCKVLLASAFLNILFCGGWIFLSKGAYSTLDDILQGRGIIEISVIGLWGPVGLFGLCVLSVASPCVAIITGKRSDLVWGDVGNKILKYIVNGFALLGVITAVGAYQWMTHRLEAQGYSYCRPLSTFSAMGRYEVYVAKPELCVKPNKIP